MIENRLCWIVGLVALAGCARADAPVDENPIRVLAPGLYAMDYAGSHGKSLIVELDRAIAVIEVPVNDLGAEAQELADHAGDGARALGALARRFPDKPVAYVLASHWHPHSLGALSPFLKAGIPIVTTRSSWERLRGMAPGLVTPASAILIDGDTRELGDPAHRIIAHRFTRQAYPATPTDEYLYFDLPGYDAVHVGCMYSKYDGPDIEGRPLVTAREVDLFALLAARGLTRRWLIRIDREPAGADERLPFARLERVVRTGVQSRALAERYRDLAPASIDALAAQVAAAHIPPGVFNTLAYDAARARDLPRALAFARLQATLAPSSINSWDTLGEIHYFAGDLAAARGYAAVLPYLDPSFTGGEPVWQADLRDL